MKARGSAIIIAMLLISAVGSIAFGISRVIYIESTSASTYVNGAIAYYAAESGLEEGFLRYRYNQNAEVPFTNWDLNPEHNYVYRSNLSDISLVSDNDIFDPTTVVSDASKQYYDLRMGYLGTYGEPYYGHNADAIIPASLSSADASVSSVYGTGDYSFIKVNQDESIKLDLSNLNLQSQALLLTLLFQTSSISCENTAEIKFEVKDFVGNVSEYKALTTYSDNVNNCASSLGIAPSNLIGGDATTSQLISMASHYYSISNIFTTLLTQYGKSPQSDYQKVTMFIKPLYHDAKVGLITSGCFNNSACKSERDKIVTGPYSSVKTTGYYGGTTRKLEANIDRQSGTLYDLFDYVIYKAS